MKLYRPFPKIGETMLDAVNVLRVVSREITAAGELLQKMMKREGFALIESLNMSQTIV